MPKRRDPITGKYIHQNPADSKLEATIAQLQQQIAGLQIKNQNFQVTTTQLKQKISTLNRSKGGHTKRINQLLTQIESNETTIANLQDANATLTKIHNRIEAKLFSYLVPSNLVKETLKTLQNEYKFLMLTLRLK